MKDGSKEEVLSYFAGIHARPRQMLDKPTSRRRWSTADREPVEKWGTERITLVGMPHIRWRNIWRREPVWRWKMPSRLVGRYSSVTAMRLMPLPCMSRCVFRVPPIVWSTREMGRVYHAAGVERQVRNLLWKGKSQAEFYRGMEWLYGWKEDNCLLPR